MPKITLEQLKLNLKRTLESYKLSSAEYDEKYLIADIIHDIYIDFEQFLDQEKESEYEAGMAEGKREATYMRD
jgi:hypothetical protein